MSVKTYGLNAERAYKKQRLKDKKVIFCVKSAGSLGKFDLVLLKWLEGNEGMMELISVKSSKKLFRGRKKEIEKIKEIKLPLLAHIRKKLVIVEKGRIIEETV